jgi:hypothetical protein
MKYFIILLSLISLQAFAQKAIDDDQRVSMRNSTGGGNGGHPIEERAVIVLKEIREFFKNVDNQLEFPEINFIQFDDVISKQQIFAGEFDLVDKYNTPRCLINFDNIIKIDEVCWKKYLNQNDDHYSILFHEVLGQMGLETAGKYVPSEYEISSRLEKYVQRLNKFGLVNVNQLENVEGIGLVCSPFGSSRRVEYTKTFFLIKLNEDKTLEIYTKDSRPKMFKINWAYWFPTDSGQLYINSSDFRSQSSVTNIDIKESGDEKSHYDNMTKKIKIDFKLWKSKVDHFVIPLSDILLLDTNYLNEITVEKHMIDGNASALKCRPMVLNDFERAKNILPIENENIYHGLSDVKTGHILTIQNYFRN